jgi:hypothetical protein
MSSIEGLYGVKRPALFPRYRTLSSTAFQPAHLTLLLSRARMADCSLDERLYHSCKDGLLSEALRYIATGANVNWSNPRENFSTALYVASYNGHAQLVDALARAGADIDACNQAGLFSLFIAAQYVVGFEGSGLSSLQYLNISNEKQV